MTEWSGFWNGTTTGDATSAPYDANTEFADWVKRGFGIGGNRANAGVVLGTGSEATQLDALQVTQNSPAGMSVLLNIGAAMVDGTEYWNDSALTLAIAANGSGNSRIDTIVLRKSWTSQTVRAFVLAGTPAGSPVPPTLTQSAGVTWEIPIADILVANGAVSITTTVVTSRALYTSAADGVYLDRILNSSGATMETGAVARWNTARDVFTGGTYASSGIPAGVQIGRLANGAIGRMLNRGIGYVMTTGAVVAGQFGSLFTGTSGRAVATDEIRVNSFCRFLETTSGTGLALAFIDAGIHPQFGSLRSTRMSIAAAALATTTIPVVQQGSNTETGTLVVEIMARSAIAATTEIANLRLGGSSLDTTAANYFSYSHLVANSTPAVTALSNLGATAGIQFTIVGNNAPANVFSHIVFQIAYAYSLTYNKILTGTSFMPSSTTNGTIYNIQIGGRWISTEAITLLNLVTAGANNLMAGSYMNIYYKDVL